MTSKELRFVLAIGEFSLKTAETQASLAKLLLAHIDGLNNIRQLRSRMARLPDSDELRLLGVELDERESAVSAEIASLRQPLRDALAKAESDHEWIGSALAAVRASLPPPTGQELPCFLIRN